MAMTRKHYREAAERFARIRSEFTSYDDAERDVAEYVLNRAVTAMAKLFAEDNDRFDYARFYKAAGSDQR